MKDQIKEIKDLIKEGNVVFGTEQTLKSAKNGTLKIAFVASNCKEDIKKDLTKYSNIGKFELVELEMNNRDLGTISKKPFSIAIIGVLN